MSTPAIAASCSQYITDIAAAPEQADLTTPPNAGWVPVTLPDVWQQRWPSENTVWYRIRWQDDCAGSREIALALSSMSMAGTIYLNDSLLWRDANLEEPYSRSWNMPRYWLLPEAALTGTRNTLWIRITGMRHDMLGLGEVNLGDPASIWSLHRQQTWIQRHLYELNMSISLVLGSLFLILWMVRRREKAFGWYALASLSWSVFASTMLATSPWFFANSTDWNRWVCTVLVLYVSAFCQFIWVFGDQRLRYLKRALWSLSLLTLLLVWLVPEQQLTPVLMVSIPLYTLILLSNCVQFQFHAWRHRKRHNVFLALCLQFFLLVGLHDLLLVAGLIDGSNFYFPITSPVAMIFMFLVIADRFAKNLLRIETFNVELKTAVEKNRTELTQTLQRKHQLESRNIRLAERLAISHDLHDSLGSSLMRSIALVEQSEESLKKPRVMSMLKELRGDLRQIIDNSSSNITSENSTPVEWIAPLRHRFVRLFDELGLASHWHFPPKWPCSLSAVQLLALTRFVEEALTNAIKHSRGDTLTISLQAEEAGGAVLEVCDNGMGFDVEAISNTYGVGMQSMQTRIARIGGRLKIHSRAGETRLSVSVS